MRRLGKTPSKEFLKEKRRRSMEYFKQQQRLWYEKANSIVNEQDQFLETIKEINQINKLTGQPLIKAEVKYTKASVEYGVPQAIYFLPTPPLEDERPTKRRATKKVQEVQEVQVS